MSLFKARELWATKCDNDLFDLGCVRVGNLECNNKKYNSIVTGSYNGFLRIYNPCYTNDENDSNKDISKRIFAFRPSDLICEKSFSSPIIQVEIGRFVSTSRKKHIAILMPKRLQVYEVIKGDKGVVDQGDQFSLKFIYEHALQRNAYNMCTGPFGGSSGGSSSAQQSHEYICVQSMDGTLSIFEYESYALSCFLPKALIPGPIKYIPKTDSFVTVGSSWQLESYKYQVLATSAKSFSGGADASQQSKQQSSSSSSSENANNNNKKTALPEFTYNLGEAALDIEIVHAEHHFYSILVLGERNLFCLTDTGVLKFMRKFDFNPSAFCAYTIKSSSGNNNTNNNNSSAGINFIVATHSKVLLVHEDVRVKWAAQVDHVPVQIAVAKINELNGCIVSLSEDGQLKVMCLGTEPALLNPLIQDDMGSRQFDAQQAEREYRVLQARIKEAIMNTGAVMQNVNKSGLIMSVDVPARLDQSTPLNKIKDTELTDPLESIPSITCKLVLKTAETIQNVKISINPSLPIIAVPATICFTTLNSVPVDQEVCFYLKTKHTPTSLNVNVCATYSYGPNSATKISETKFRLPLRLVARAGQLHSKFDQDQSSSSSANNNNDSNLNNNSLAASKSLIQGLKKVTLETNKPCVNLVELFPEFAAVSSGSFPSSSSSSSTGGNNIIAAQYYGHAHINVTIQGAKSGANRYRIQCENYDSMWLIAQEFVSRLQQHFSNSGVIITTQEALPVDDFRHLIDKHLELRDKLEYSNQVLEKNAQQFRAIQKRLLTKFKDKSPTSIDSMEALLNATYERIIYEANLNLSTQRDLSIAATSLNNMSNIYVLLLSLAFKLNKDDIEVLNNIMSFKMPDTPELGWEETINMAVTNLMRLALSKGKETSTQQQQANLMLKKPTDSSKLEKQIKSLISKFEGGASLVSSVYFKQAASSSFETTTATTTTMTTNPTTLAQQARTRIEQQVQLEEPVKPRHPVAARNRMTLGEDYDEDEENDSSNQSREKAPKEEEPVKKKPFGKTNLPTYDELIKLSGGVDLDDKGFASDNDD